MGAADKETRTFFVVDSIEDNEEIFETLEEARNWYNKLSPSRTEDEVGDSNERRIRVCLVRNAYKEDDGSWNYEDSSDTFDTKFEILNNGE